MTTANMRNGLLQDTLSKNGSFILCDANVSGFPIRYTSPGFTELFEYSAEECLGKKCVALVADPSDISCKTYLSSAAIASGLAPTKVEEAITVFTRYAILENRTIMKNPQQKISYTITLNRKKGGTLFVCENIMLVLKHPSIHWLYVIGLQRDIVKEVSVEQLLSVVYAGTHEQFIKNQEESMKNRVSVWGTDGELAVEHFHEKAIEMWQKLMSQTPRIKSKVLKSPSLASISTASSDNTLHMNSTDIKPGVSKLRSKRGRDACHVLTSLNLTKELGDLEEPMAPRRSKSMAWSHQQTIVLDLASHKGHLVFD